MRGGCIRRLAVRFFIEILAGIYPGYQRFSSRCSAEDTSDEKKSGSCLSGQGRRHERRSWMFENKRVCNWLGAIEGFALWSKAFRAGHYEDSKPETAHEKPLAPRVAGILSLQENGARPGLYFWKN